jgi:uncharacterized protein (TIGR02266 family)
MSNSKDDRRTRRRRVRLLVDYVCEKGVRCDYATNLSPGGLFLESDDPLPAGATLKMRFRLPGAEELHEVEGQVTWVRREWAGGASPHAPGMGVRFSDGPATTRIGREIERL